MSFNKLVETQLAQIAVAIPVSDSGKIPGQHETSLESVKMVSTKFGKRLRRVNYDYHLDPPFIAKKEDPGHQTSHARSAQKSLITLSVTLEQALKSCPR